ncbi:MAG: zinc-binding dehydrogenase [Betaproteobacteria bacterium]
MLTDGPNLEARVRAAIGEAALPLANDAVGGSGTQRLARCLSDGGTVVNYGVLSGEPCMVDGRDTVFRDVRIQGFWLRKWYVDTPPAQIAALYRELAAWVADGTLAVEVEAVYPVRRIKEAVAHAARGGRSGKILVSFAKESVTDRQSDSLIRFREWGGKPAGILRARMDRRSLGLSAMPEIPDRWQVDETGAIISIHDSSRKSALSQAKY